MTDKKSKRVYTIKMINLFIQFIPLVVLFWFIVAGMSSFAALSLWAVINILIKPFEQYLLYNFGYRKIFKLDWINLFKFVGYNLPLLLFSMSFGRLLDTSSAALSQITGFYNILLFLIVVTISFVPLAGMAEYSTCFISKMYK